ncbi:DUF932 domain-containing protein [Nevskia ramosa]|uniref:DUF932 domain-containing protein n=1 Tax=Nevskia ramosa TaxID=64002 RepID=UPI0023554FD9|nr:DUF932 domain-containing protein [Nevskia ramosa]
MPSLATRFGRNRAELRSSTPLANEAIKAFAPSIFAEEPHGSRSARYSYIPTSKVLDGLRGEGFEPFMVAQCRTRDETRKDFTKHLIRFRHATQIEAREETQEIILINSHDGTSSYQLLAGCFRFACANGLIVGEQTADIRVPHKGDVQGTVIEGAFRVLSDFERVADNIHGMKAITLDQGEQLALGRAALALRYDEDKAPIEPEQVIETRRRADRADDLWSVFNRVQESTIRGGQTGYSQDGKRRVRTREITGIDQGVKLNRALWVLAEEMRRLKAA